MICGRGGSTGGVAADCPYRDVRAQKISNDTNGRGVFMGIGGFPNITPPEAFSRQKNTGIFNSAGFPATLGHEHQLQTLGK
jgi:hypothetical protein